MLRVLRVNIDIFFLQCGEILNILYYDWIEQHIKPSRVILYLESRESHSLYIYIYIFCAVVSEIFVCKYVSSIQI